MVTGRSRRVCFYSIWRDLNANFMLHPLNICFLIQNDFEVYLSTMDIYLEDYSVVSVSTQNIHSHRSACTHTCMHSMCVCASMHTCAIAYNLIATRQKSRLVHLESYTKNMGYCIIKHIKYSARIYLLYYY
jgi:hypothetical protein